ncbi:MAG: bifunctional methylenetetrahydrofolate dehydrogenase/methenyltetrahydrofolate cyclohydrolase FolD [Methylobacteriaceae bacterium]|nr:bifunctional methylenetetrahydrofolate dehydrogenase/methenyltetrahydrofolate cyclohydrolase FolD [Methylobacteriaceae bacterium]
MSQSSASPAAHDQIIRPSGAGAMLIDGRAAADRILQRVGTEAAALSAATGFRPGLAVVLVGENPASEVYVKSKGRAASACGFHSLQHTLSGATSEAELLDVVGRLNADASIHGILVQLPLPGPIDALKVIEAVAPEKDVDGFHPVNAGRLAVGDVRRALVPCTPAGALVLLKQTATALGVRLAGCEAVVVGRSNIVGKPMAQLLLAENCTVTIAHSRTRDLPAVVRRADIVVAAVGRPQMVRGDWLKPGAIVIDVGINRIAPSDAGKARLVGDVEFETALARAGAITPVPGGVGPMTIAMLMANTLTAACRAGGRPPPEF